MKMIENALKYLAPGLFNAKGSPPTQPIFGDVSQGFSSIVTIGMGVLMNPDIAYRTDRRLQEQMIRDPMIVAPLFKRMLALAQTDWQILPEDDKDEEQKATAKNIERIIRRTPRMVDLFRNLDWAIFRGTGVVETNWCYDAGLREWWIDSHRPHNGDKITYDLLGNPRILTRNNQTAGEALSEDQQNRLIIHTYDPEDGSFYEGAEAGYIFKGRGLRDSIWQYWWLKHNALKFWLRFMERFGGGMVFGKYPMGNKNAKDAIESVIKNLLNDSMVSVPVPSDVTEKDLYGVEVATVGGAEQSCKLFENFVEGWAGKHIRILIEGQEQANQTSGDGLGSGRADALQDIFKMFVGYDKSIMECTLTEQLVKRVQAYNYGELAYGCKFKYVDDQQNWEDQKSRLDTAKAMGLKVPKAWLYDQVGAPVPQDTDEVIDLGTMAAMDQAQQNQGGGLFGGQQDTDISTTRLFRTAIAGDGEGEKKSYTDDEGDWVTINGAHVLIKNGIIKKGPPEMIGQKHNAPVKTVAQPKGMDRPESNETVDSIIEKAKSEQWGRKKIKNELYKINKTGEYDSAIEQLKKHEGWSTKDKANQEFATRGQETFNQRQQQEKDREEKAKVAQAEYQENLKKMEAQNQAKEAKRREEISHEIESNKDVEPDWPTYRKAMSLMTEWTEYRDAARHSDMGDVIAYKRGHEEFEEMMFGHLASRHAFAEDVWATVRKTGKISDKQAKVLALSLAKAAGKKKEQPAKFTDQDENSSEVIEELKSLVQLWMKDHAEYLEKFFGEK